MSLKTNSIVSWKRYLSGYLALLVTLLLMLSPLSGSSQRAKKLKVNPNKQNNVKMSKPNTVRGSKPSPAKGTLAPAMLLNGGKQFGIRAVYLATGFGAEADFGYLFKEKFIVEGVAGFHYESLSDVEIVRIPIHAGLKYRLLNVSQSFGLYSGLGINIVFQSQSNIETKQDFSKVIWGPSFFGEGVWNIKSSLAIILRGEQVLAPSEKFINAEGKEEALKMLNLSLGLRKTF